MAIAIAIIGRPNVGKSTLFNRLVGKRLALVDNMPGLTRDRREGEGDIEGETVTYIDTAGLEETQKGSIEERMRKQTETAIEEADLILFLIDGRAGLIASDHIFAQIVRRSGKPILLVVNKCEGQASNQGVYEASALGLGDPIAISAEHGIGVGDLISDISERMEKEGFRLLDGDRDGGLEEEKADRPLRVAIVGRPNVGKSTLVNKLMGEERMMTGPEAGLTRDSIAVDFSWEGRNFYLYDTAGLRRKSRIKKSAEQLSVKDSLSAIRFAEMVVLLIDSEKPFEKQDLIIADLISREGRAGIIALNKWDLVEDPASKRRELSDEVERLLPQLRGVPLIPLSAKTGKGVEKIMQSVMEVSEIWNRRLPTGALNRFLREAVDRHSPPAVQGRRIKLRYITQPSARPPTFVIFCSRPEDLPKAYERYLINGLREAFDMPAVPLRLYFRKGKNPYA